jgi:hypothetical protein
MALPILVQNNAVISAGSMSGNLSSGSIEVKEMVRYSVQSIWTGSSPGGTVTVLASNDNINFDTIPNNSSTISGNTGSSMLLFDTCDYAYVQIYYTASSGSGSLNVYLCGKRK